MTIVRELPQVDQRDAQQAGVPRALGYADRQRRREELRKNGDDVDVHG